MSPSFFTAPLEWLDAHINQVGWLVIASYIVWLWRKSVLIVASIMGQHEKSEKALSQIDLMATNCFPTMQADLKALNAQTEQGNKVLVSIDRGITLLVDRTARSA